MKSFLEFIDNDRKVIITIFFLILIALFIPFPSSIRFTIFILIMILIYINIFRRSILASTTIVRIMIWLICAPFKIIIIVTGYISLIWVDILQSRYFLISFVFLFILSWILAAYIFELKKVKAAILILNSIFSSILSVAFLTTLDADISKLVFDESIIQEAVNKGLSLNNLIETFVKILTFPYVLSAIWALLIVELRSLGIIRR